jgi:UDP-arabinose 4-epimerase
MERILVTGGAGYIGSHTAKLLAQSGVQPVVYDNFSRGNRWAVLNWPCIEAGLDDGERLRAALRDNRITSVIHFAAYAYVGESVQDPREYYWNNTVNTLRLLDAMRDCGVKNIVFSSSCATYGNPESLPIREDHPQRPVSPYGESKLMVERILASYGGAYGLKWVALRYFNAAGADPDGELGEDHNPETHLIPLALRAAEEADPLVIFGTDYPTADGAAIRDYVHVSDLAAAHLASMRHLEAGGQSTAFNLGTGAGASVWEVVRAAESVTGLTIPVRAAPRRPGDPAVLVADATRAASILGWRPRFSSLDAILRTAWQRRLRVRALESQSNSGGLA